MTEDGNIYIYSRNQENNTSKYPDIINRLDSVKGPNVKSFVMDSEAVAWDREKKKILPFQILSTRKRKVPFILKYYVFVVTFFYISN